MSLTIRPHAAAAHAEIPGFGYSGARMTEIDTRPAWPVFTPGEDPIDTVVKLSRYYGRLPGFVIAGGGNTSVKDSTTLHVKASGVPLAAIERDGFVALDRARLQILSETEFSSDPATRETQFKEAVLAARRAPERGQRPSVEALLHHLLSARFVVHSHATLVNAITCCVNGPQIAYELFGGKALWIPYVDPGYILARTLRQLLAARATGCPKIVLMANHGLIVSGDSPDDIRQTTDHVITRISARLGDRWRQSPFGTAAAADPQLIRTIASALQGLLAESDRMSEVTFDDSPLVASFVSGEAAATLPFKGPLNPDQIVYCNSFPLHFAPGAGESSEAIIDRLRDAVAGHRARYGYLPRVILVRGVGLFAAGDDPKLAATARDLFKDAIEIFAGATSLGGAIHLSDRQRIFIEQWEAEAYRKQIAAGGARPKAL
jgi:rhamnose utilization protein RhaD (predicted bifunctional aldolase and dehydrogenase)